MGAIGKWGPGAEGNYEGDTGPKMEPTRAANVLEGMLQGFNELDSL